MKGCGSDARADRLGGFLFLLLLRQHLANAVALMQVPLVEDRRGDEVGGVGARDDADDVDLGKGLQTLAADEEEEERRHEHRARGQRGPRERLVHGEVTDLAEALVGHDAGVLADSVEDHDGVVDREAHQDHHGGDDFQADLDLPEAGDQEDEQQVMQQRDDGRDTEDQFEAEPEVNQDRARGEDGDPEGQRFELLAGLGAEAGTGDHGVGAGGREGSLEGGFEGFLRGLDFLARAKELDVDDVVVGQGRIGHLLDVGVLEFAFQRAAQLGGVHLILELDFGAVTAREVDAVARGEPAGGEDRDQHDEEDQRRAAPGEPAHADEVDPGLLEDRDFAQREMAELLEPEAAQGVGDGQAGEEVGDQAVGHREGEAEDRTFGELEQDQRREQGGDVGVQNDGVSAMEAEADGLLQRLAGAQFLTDALVNQNVGVHGHADGQQDAADAGEGQRGVGELHQRQDDQNVEDQGEHGDHTGGPVVEDHQRDDEDRTPEEGADAGPDRVHAESGADGAAAFDLQRGLEGAGLEDLDQVGGLILIEAAGDGGAAFGDAFLEVGVGADDAVENDGELVADVVAGDLGELLGALFVELEPDVDRVFDVVGDVFDVGAAQVLAGQFGALVDQDAAFLVFHLTGGRIHAAADLIGEEFGARGDHDAGLDLAIGADDLAVAGVDEVELQLRRLDDGAQDAIGVLFAGDLNADAIVALGVNAGLGDAEGVDAVGNALFGAVEVALELGFEGDAVEFEDNQLTLGEVVGTGGGDDAAAEPLLDDVDDLLGVGGVHLAQAHGEGVGLGFGLGAEVLDIELLIERVDQVVDLVGDGFLLVDDQGDVDAADQVQTQRNGAGAQCLGVFFPCQIRLVLFHPLDVIRIFLLPVLVGHLVGFRRGRRLEGGLGPFHFRRRLAQEHVVARRWEGEPEGEDRDESHDEDTGFRNGLHRWVLSFARKCGAPFERYKTCVLLIIS